MRDVVGTPSDPLPRPGDSAIAYRCFLFADLRGYTAFVEHHGDDAGAMLLDAYRSLVRGEVSRHEGAEIRTEGDSFYVVFASARNAVSCALAIVAAAGRHSVEYPDQPIRVGIGINAGETVQRGEGFVGSAVNLAARVCSQAQAGEVLVTAAVRDAAGAGSGLRFVARGGRHLKGIDRPISLFAVTPESMARPGVRAPSRAPVSRSVAMAATGVVALLVVGGAYAVLVADDEASAPIGPSAPSGTRTPPAVAATAPPSPVSSAFPNPAEQELLAPLDPIVADHCDRADDKDRPIYRIDPAEAATFGTSTRLAINVDAGIVCDIPSVAAPDAVYFWGTRYTHFISSVELPEALIRNEAGAWNIPVGDCANGQPAFGRWEIGDLGGWLLCRTELGDAVLRWTYDGRGVYATAVRRDGDFTALLRWWRDEARLIGP